MMRLLLVVLLGVVRFNAAVHRIGLIRVESPRERMIREGTWKDFIQHRDDQRMIFKTSAGTNRTARRKVTDFSEFGYMVMINIGTPPQEFLVIPDTGSFGVWVPDVSCEQREGCPDHCKESACDSSCDMKCCEASVCAKKNTFRSSKSSTYYTDGREWKIDYLETSASGFLGVDMLALEDINGNHIYLPNTTFGQTTMVPDSGDFTMGPVDGILGLCPLTIHIEGNLPPMVNALQGVLNQPIFTVYFHNPTAQQGHFGGMITYGNVDTEHCESIVYHPLASVHYWFLAMNSIAIGNYSTPKRQFRVLSDTGTAFIHGPRLILQGMIKEIGAELNNTSGLYQLSCDQTNNIKINIGGDSYEIRPKNYMTKLESGMCALEFHSFSSANFGVDFILGYPLILEYCHIYDFGNKRIGLAKIKSTDHI